MKTPESVRVPEWLLRNITDYCRSLLPQEACGVLRGTFEDAAIRITSFEGLMNTSPEPERRFEIHPEGWVRALLETGGDPLIGIFHSHPSAPPSPSDEDRQLPWAFDVSAIASFRDGSPQWKCYRLDGNGGWFELSLHTGQEE